jgi:hypothetical protein
MNVQVMKSFLKYIVLFFLFSCSGKDGDLKFRLVPSSESGITFRNTLSETLDFNIFNYMYFYNGAGVAVGDLNGDGLLDIYFTANQEPNKLYLNQGDFKFKDVTESAGVKGFNGWATGVTMADVNGDGRLDIYVGYIGDYLIFKGKNQLFINEGNDASGIPIFKDRAIEYGLDLVGFSNQASFFDYDRDGDLDMFMLNHSLHQNGTFGTSKGLRSESHPTAGDKLMRNESNRFVDVTKQAHILDNAIGYGLGVVVSDVNLDGWPDIYVGNDFHENDYLYINQKDGTFKETLEMSMNHTSRYTMGVDFADFNNDAFPDLVAMDMLPKDQIILKSSAAEDAFDTYEFKINYGYNYQYSRNMLQLNQQDGTFSDIGLFAGVYATDWSWSSLFADFDLDGKKDIFVSNGILRRSNDLDYINFITVDSIQEKLNRMTEKEVSLFSKMPKIKISNFMYRNNGDSTFTDHAAKWGLDKISYSNGTAYADFDNDGDLDLVINNIEDEAFLYENRTISKKGGRDEEKQNHFLQISLAGKKGNNFGIGAKVILYDQGELQIQECMPTRGYESSVDYRLSFGLGDLDMVDSLKVIWSDGTCQVIKQVKANQSIVLSQSDAGFVFDYSTFHKNTTLFAKGTLAFPYRHQENKFVEFNREALMPHMVSAEGPGIAVGDVNGDGLEDIYAGGAKWQIGTLMLQGNDGKFQTKTQQVFRADSTYEDVAALFSDVDGDNDQDLIVISGGNEFSGKSEMLNPRLYLNDGKANFSRSNEFKDIFLTGSSVAATDFDKDGDIDLFIGARAVPWKYGVKPDSYLLENDGNGKFSDVTDKVAPFLRQFGFVKSSVWVDIDNDKDEDLIIAAEWNPITILIMEKGKLSPLKLDGSGLENTEGWWNVVYPKDFDNDGDMDFLMGNLGLNSKLKASKMEPIKLYVNDFDKNGTVEQILSHYVNGKEYPFHTRDEMTKQLPYLKKKYLSYRKFSEATLHDVFTKQELGEASQLKAVLFESVYVENKGGNTFEVRALPKAAQFSPIQSVLDIDFNKDGLSDIILGGNFYPSNIQMGRYDASFGQVVKNFGAGNFKVVPNFESGLQLRGEVKKIVPVKTGKTLVYLVFANNDSIQSFTLKK